MHLSSAIPWGGTPGKGGDFVKDPVEVRNCPLLKGWFTYDRGSRIAIRSAIVCDHMESTMETYFCDRLRSCDRDRRRSQKIEPCSISCDRLRSPAINCDYAIIWKPKFCDPRSKRIRVLSHDSTLVCSIVGTVYVATIILRNLWRKLLVMNVLTIAAAKILKTRTKRPTMGQNRAEVLFISRGSGGQISQHKNCVRSLSNPKPMFSTVLELTTTRFMTNERSKFAWGKISALPRSRCCLLFSLHAHVYLTFPLTKRMATVGHRRTSRGGGGGRQPPQSRKYSGKTPKIRAIKKR